MRLRSDDVLFPQALVEGDGGIYLPHDRSRTGREASAPHAVGAFSRAIFLALRTDTAPAGWPWRVRSAIPARRARAEPHPRRGDRAGGEREGRVRANCRQVKRGEAG